MANNISSYHGRVSKCKCGIADDASKMSERACRQCFARGFVAECNACDGTGKTMQKMAGGPGTMSSTCIQCGGIGMFGVNKPEDWSDVPVSAEISEAVTA